jgi:hypothetical protein
MKRRFNQGILAVVIIIVIVITRRPKKSLIVDLSFLDMQWRCLIELKNTAAWSDFVPPPGLHHSSRIAHLPPSFFSLSLLVEEQEEGTLRYDISVIGFYCCLAAVSISVVVVSVVRPDLSQSKERG